MRPEITWNGKKCINLISNIDLSFTVIYRNGRKATIPGLPVGKIGLPHGLTICIKIDPRYHYTQNREQIELRPEYAGESETWTLK